MRLEEFEANLALRVLISQFRSEYRDQVPTKTPSNAARDLTLVHGLEVIRAHKLVDQEEVVAVLGGKLSAQIEIGLLIVHTLLLVGNDLYRATLSNGSLVALKMLLKCLIDGGDNLIDCKLHFANQIVSIIIVQIVEVVDIINHDFVIFSFLEVIGDLKVLDPLGRQIIHDYLSLTDFLPHVALFFEEYTHTIGTRESVQVRQVFTLEGKSHYVN